MVKHAFCFSSFVSHQKQPVITCNPDYSLVHKFFIFMSEYYRMIVLSFKVTISNTCYGCTNYKTVCSYVCSWTYYGNLVIRINSRVESGLNDPDYLGHLGYFLEGQVGIIHKLNYLDVTQICNRSHAL